MMRRVWGASVVLAAVTTAVVYGGQVAPGAPNDLPLTDIALERGGATFMARCASCHGERGDGRTGASSPGVARLDLVDLVQRRRAEADIAAALTAAATRHAPAVFAGLDAPAERALVAWVRSLGGVRLRVRATDGGAGYAWDLPPGFPQPKVPADNPMTPAKVELGRFLFYDTRLSRDGTYSCASCHQQRLAFTDGKARAVGVTGQVHPRGAMGLANVAYSPVLTWADPTARRLETQMLVPMFAADPVELGLAGQEQTMLARLAAEPRYPAMFAAGFPGETAPITLANLTKAIASFERTLLSGRSPYDLYRTSADPRALPPAAQRGEEIFFSERTGCFQCHGGFNFTAAVDYVGLGRAAVTFHNTGLYNLGGDGGYPPPNTGVHAVTGDPADMGRFKPPSLRNIALTAPYMHDGSLGTLEDVIRHYEAGGRSLTAGPHRGVGANNPRKSPLVRGFTLSDQERADLVAFLDSLTDLAFTSDARFANPWPEPTAAARPSPRQQAADPAARLSPSWP